MITAGRMIQELDWWVMMGLFAIVSFLALCTELYWRERIRQETLDLEIERDLWYAFQGDE